MPSTLHATSSTSFDARVFTGRLLDGRLLLHGFFQLDVERGGDELGDAIHFREADVEHAAHVFDRGARAQRAERDDLRHLLAPVFLGDVLNHFAAAPRMEVDIDIGHADALRIQEALKQQAVFQRIDIGDLHGVADQAAGGRSAARSDGNAARFREADEVPDDQEVAGELHLLDGADLAIQALGSTRPDRASSRPWLRSASRRPRRFSKPWRATYSK